MPVCLSPYVTPSHVNRYKVVYRLLQKIYRQPLKKIAYLTTRTGFLAQRQGQGQGLTSLTLYSKLISVEFDKLP